MTSTSTYNALMASSIRGLPGPAALQAIGQLIDLSSDLRRHEGTAKAIEWCDGLSLEELSDHELVLADYFRANAWANRAGQGVHDREAAWRWTQPELQQQLYFLRRAISRPGFESLEAHRRCQIWTNLGNQLNTLGRFIEAVECWGRALAIEPRFGMARGNRGLGLISYAGALYDCNHRPLFVKFAHADLRASLADDALYEGSGYDDAKRAFAAKLESIEQHFGRDADYSIDHDSLNDYELGRQEPERRYRIWCLQNRLFLNPLNDLCTEAIGARDPLTQPSLYVPAASAAPPAVIGFFSQMKQEFVSARWEYYEGITDTGTVHHSDRRVLLYDTLDQPSYSLSAERVKNAFRAAYSLFDKIAFFLNSYIGLNVKETQVSFRRIWFDPRKKDLTIRPELDRSENWPLRGLYWLSKDLFDEEMRDVASPDAKALHDIRNHLEHKYLQLYQAVAPRVSDSAVADALGYALERREFEEKTLRVLKLSKRPV